jgi:large conductance mechanosensitive channel
MRKPFLTRFKEFLVSGSISDVALGILIGTAVTPLANSLLEDLILPPFNTLKGTRLRNRFWVLKEGRKKKSYRTLKGARSDGAIVIGYGSFSYHLLNFLIIASLVLALTEAKRKLQLTDVSKEMAKLTSKFQTTQQG